MRYNTILYHRMPTKAIDYSKTVIYKIVCNDLNITDVYVGSTTDFTSRKRSHKNACNSPTNRNYHLKIYQTIRANGGWDNWTIVVIENFPCNNGEQARTRERYWYDCLNAGLNSIRPLITADEDKERQRLHSQIYQQDNRERLNVRHREYMRENAEARAYQQAYLQSYYQENRYEFKAKSAQYYLENRDTLKAKSSQYYESQKNIKQTCVCGSICSKPSFSYHLKSLKHLAYIAKQNPVDVSPVSLFDSLSHN